MLNKRSESLFCREVNGFELMFLALTGFESVKGSVGKEGTGDDIPETGTATGVALEVDCVEFFNSSRNAFRKCGEIILCARQ